MAGSTTGPSRFSKHITPWRSTRISPSPPTINLSPIRHTTPIAGRFRFFQDACTASSEHGGAYNASRYPDAEIGPGAAAQHLGRRRADPGDRGHGADRLWRRADRPALVGARCHAGIARAGQSSGLRAATNNTDAARHSL